MTAGPQGATGPTGPTGPAGVNGTIPDSSQFYFLNGTRALTGKMDAGNYNLSHLLNPVSPQDAATKNYVDAVGQTWTTYTPTFTWSVTPTSPIVIARWTQTGRIVHCYINYYSADSNAGVLTYITLPKSASSQGNLYVPFSGITWNTNAFTRVSVDYYIDFGWLGNVKTYGFPATTDGQYIYVLISGEYEVD
jgi:hypothetical protein